MKKYSFILLLSFLLFTTCKPPEFAPMPIVTLLPIAKPTDVGLKAENFSKIDDLLNGYVNDKKLAGSVAMVLKDGKVVHFKAYGYQDKEANIEMQSNTIFRLASMTKAITSLAILMLEDQGKLNTNDLVSKYIPEMKNPKVFKDLDSDSSIIFENAKTEVRISHLLTHTSGIAYGFMSPLAKKWYTEAKIPDGANKYPITIGQTMPKLAKQPLLHEPGEKFTYGLSTDMLGYIVEVASGMPLDKFLKTQIFEPLRMNDTYFYLPEDKASRLSQHYVETKNGVIAFNKVDDSGFETFPIDGAKTYFSGGGGLCSTAFDYARFLQMVLNDGELNNMRIISKETIQKMKTNQLDENISVFGNSNKGFTFGFEYQKSVTQADSYRFEGRLGWGGIFGTHYWMNPNQNIAAIIMTQTYPQPSRNELFRQFEILVNGAVIE